ncbi:hypothetical protein [Salinithrix halophila]|uniref:hypothetical protein n=1 Tax=Salinithrix halophila TaxID=1485204 RepID=UPI0036D42448
MEQKHDSRVIYFGFFISSFFGLISILYPEPKQSWITFWLVIVLISGVWTLVGLIRRLDQSRYWKGIYTIVQFDLFSLFGFVIFYRGTGEELWVGILSIMIFVSLTWWALKNRRLVLSEVFAPKRKISFVLRLVGTGGEEELWLDWCLERLFPTWPRS